MRGASCTRIRLYATAIASLADPEIKPIDQNTARYYNRVAIDLGFSGVAETRTKVTGLRRSSAGSGE